MQGNQTNMAPNKRYKSTTPYDVTLRPSNNSNRSGSRLENSIISNNENLKASRPNKVLRLTIQNPCEQTTTQMIFHAFSVYGRVVRIVLWNTQSLYCQNGMVEYDCIEGTCFVMVAVQLINMHLSLQLQKRLVLT